MNFVCRPQTTGFSFGAAPNATAPAPASSFGVAKPGGFNFSSPAATTSNTTFSTPIATVGPQPAQPQSAPTNVVQPLSSISFSSPTVQPQGISFGQPSSATQQTAPQSTPSLSFGMSPTTAQTQAQPAPPRFSFNQQQAATTTAAPTLSFGLSATGAAPAASLSLNPLTTAAPSTGLTFGQPSSQAAPPLFGSTQAQTSLLGSLNTQQAPAVSSVSLTLPQNVGLGGNDMSLALPKAVEGKNESTKVKETQVPKEIVQTVEDFRTFVKQQKSLSSDIIRTTDRKLKSVSEEIQRLNCSVQEVSNNAENNKLTIKLLRGDTSRVIQHADMAQRTHETPSGLQFENIMPQIYFNELIHKYESDLLTLKHQVELTEKHLQSLSNPQNFSPQDLKRGLQQIHESFIALAGRLQETHTKVETQKDQYLNLRKVILRDSTDVFEAATNDVGLSKPSEIQYGPNPFTTSTMGHSGFNISNQAAARQWSTQQQTNTFFGNSSFNTGFKKM